MPELPEVETVANTLAPYVRGRKVVKLELFDPKLQAMIAWPEWAEGRVIEDVRRFGKQAVIVFKSEGRNGGRQRPLWLAVHLRMTGRLVWRELNDLEMKPPIRARLMLDRGCVLFHDVRRFGTMRLIERAEELAPGGIDPVGEEFTVEALATLLEGARQQLKPWLLRQDRLVGIGNIYASEILHEARLSPLREGATLTAAEVRRLHRATGKILRWGIECGGTTFSDFQNAHGASGGFQKKLAVYGRESEPCRRCRTLIERIVQQQRSTLLPGLPGGKERAMSLAISSTAFANNERIPLRYARDGEDLSPPLVWDDLPAGTVELALVCDDPDAPTADPFVHWVIYGLSPDLKGLPEAIPGESEVSDPVHARQGENSWGKIGYDGPAPPRGKGMHHYHFTLYALGRRLGLPPGQDKGRLMQAMEGAVLGQTTVTGLYERR